MKRLFSSLFLIAGLNLPFVVQAELVARDLDGNFSTVEAYYDTVLDVTWLADANYARTSGYDQDGRMTRLQAIDWANSLSFYNPTINQIYSDWRLPVINPVNGLRLQYNYSWDGGTDQGWNISSPQSEMGYMYYINLGNSSGMTYSAENGPEYTACAFAENCLSSVTPFRNIQPYLYWSETVYSYGGIWGWYFGMTDGSQRATESYNEIYAWAVSPGDVGVAAIPEPTTLLMLLLGFWLIQVAKKRRTSYAFS